jgi:hypothetical protein
MFAKRLVTSRKLFPGFTYHSRNILRILVLKKINQAMYLASDCMSKTVTKIGKDRFEAEMIQLAKTMKITGKFLFTS